MVKTIECDTAINEWNKTNEKGFIVSNVAEISEIASDILFIT